MVRKRTRPAKRSVRTKANTNGKKSAPAARELESLYLGLVKQFYEEPDLGGTEKVASRLEKVLASSPEFSGSIRGEEVRSLIAELRGDLAEATRCREAEIRKILELHARTANTAHWKLVSRQYDFSDVSDRLDLLAILYDAQGQLDRAISVLLESRLYCESHQFPFDAQDLLDEFTKARAGATGRKKVRPASRKR
jgi:hypothetical protein